MGMKVIALLIITIITNAMATGGLRNLDGDGVDSQDSSDMSTISATDSIVATDTANSGNGTTTDGKIDETVAQICTDLEYSSTPKCKITDNAPLNFVCYIYEPNAHGFGSPGSESVCENGTPGQQGGQCWWDPNFSPTGTVKSPWQARGTMSQNMHGGRMSCAYIVENNLCGSDSEIHTAVINGVVVTAVEACCECGGGSIPIGAEEAKKAKDAKDAREKAVEDARVAEEAKKSRR